MLTLEMLYAVLQGLPSSYLSFLDHGFAHFCWLVEQAFKEGHDAEGALRFAVSWSRESQFNAIKRVLAEVAAVSKIPGLSHRQQETLVALRYSKVASLRTLPQILNTDRSNIHKRLKVLVARGLAIKFFRPDGAHYFAIYSPLDRSVKTSVHRLVNDLWQSASASSTTTTTPTTTPTTAMPTT
jgi:predicted transcriptional regulator